MNRSTLLLAGYLGWVVLMTSIHDVRILAAGLLGVMVLAGRRAGQILYRSLRAIVWFNLAVTLAYVVFMIVPGRGSWSFVALFNTRVGLLTASSFLLVARLDLFRALAFSRTLTWLLVIAHSQIVTQRRILRESLQALRSRTLGRLRYRDLYQHRGAAGGWVLGRGLRDAGEITLAMRSRGFFDD